MKIFYVKNGNRIGTMEAEKIITQILSETSVADYTAIYKKYADDDNFRSRYQEFIFDILWSNANQMRK